MQKTGRITIIIMALIIMASLLGANTINAAMRKDVTKQRKSEVQKFLKPYHGFLALPIYGERYNGENDSNPYRAVKFDDYYKTNMLVYAAGWNEIDVNGKTKIKEANKHFLPKLKNAFGKSAKFKLQKCRDAFAYTTYPNIYANIDGKLQYIGGDWGEDFPYGVVKKVYRVTKSKYLVEYNSCNKIYGEKSKPKEDYHATYHIYLKEGAKGSYTISNIKLIKKLVKDNNSGQIKTIKCQND